MPRLAPSAQHCAAGRQCSDKLTLTSVHAQGAQSQAHRDLCRARWRLHYRPLWLARVGYARARRVCAQQKATSGKGTRKKVAKFQSV